MTKSIVDALRQDGPEADFEFIPPKMGDILDIAKISAMLDDNVSTWNREEAQRYPYGMLPSEVETISEMIGGHVAIIRRDASSDYGVEFPDVPGCISAGRTIEEARAMATEALAGHLKMAKVLPEFAFFDFEASGLGPGSFPTELGWAIVTSPGTVETGSALIRPEPEWLEPPGVWEPAAEAVTGITREMLERDGVSPAEALEQFRVAIGDRVLVSDGVSYDKTWLYKAATVAKVEWPLSRMIIHYDAVMAQVADGVEILSAENYARLHWPNRHRAADDAGRLAWAYMIAR